MSARKPLCLASAALVLAAAITPALALSKHKWLYGHHHHYARVDHSRTPVFPENYTAAPIGSGFYAQDPYREAPPGSAACVPMCRWDLNPCDPPYFKRADGRCDPSEHGGF